VASPALARAAGAGSPLRGIRPVPLIAVVVGCAILLSLGVWQVKRLAWKEGLLARIAALQVAPSEPLDVVLHRLGGLGEVDFVRVQASCPTLQQTPTLRLYSILDGVMGYRLITACPIAAGPYRSLLVDRGFVPNEQAAAAAAPQGPIAGPIVGVLRKPEPHNWLTPVNDPARGDWRARDLPAMAASLKAPKPAPVFLMLEQPAAPAPGPVPAAVPTDIPNNHLGYALTWFGLAAGLVGMYVASVLRIRREG
jgi:surfeit locus 1 family protein